MKDLIELKKEINDKFNIEYKNVSSIPHVDNIGYKTFGKNWATTVSISIVDFNSFISNTKNEVVTKILQSFISLLAEKASEFVEFRDIYYLGGEITVIFDTQKKESVSRAVEFGFYANSLINCVLSNEAYKKFKVRFHVGVGISTSGDNSLVVMGPDKLERKFSTLIGSSAEDASSLSKKANRRIEINNYPAILIDDNAYSNSSGSVKESLGKWFKRYGTLNQSKIWGGNIIKSKYNK